MQNCDLSGNSLHFFTDECQNFVGQVFFQTFLHVLLCDLFLFGMLISLLCLAFVMNIKEFLPEQSHPLLWLLPFKAHWLHAICNTYMVAKLIF